MRRVLDLKCCQKADDFPEMMNLNNILSTIGTATNKNPRFVQSIQRRYRPKPPLDGSLPGGNTKKSQMKRPLVVTNLWAGC